MSTEDDLGDKAVLTILAEVPDARTCLDAALVACSAISGSTLVALHVRVDPFDDIMPTEEVLTSEQIRAMELQAAREGQILHDIFLEWVRTARPHSPARWLDVEGGEVALVKALGSRSMLNVIVNPETVAGGHTRKAFHACIFDTHRPLLLVPRSYRAQPFRRILVGWRDTAPTRRALEAAVPWLMKADRIVILSVGRYGKSELKTAEDFFEAKGLRCESRSIDMRTDTSVGLQILHEARIVNADLLVTGAFRYGEVIEWIFGGVTEDLLRATSLPIFMHH